MALERLPMGEGAGAGEACMYPLHLAMQHKCPLLLVTALLQVHHPLELCVHANVAAVGPALARFPDRHFAGFSRVCALSIRTSVT